MVHILNGEIVSDDDPRVRGRTQPQQTSQPARRFGSVHGGSDANAPPTANAAPAAASPLQNIARQIGLEGSVTIPAVLGIPSRPVQKIHLAVGAVLTAFFGWRALVFLAFAYFLSTQQPRRT